MATKRIERTIIEGGRAGYSTADRRRENRKYRHKTHVILKALQQEGSHDEYLLPIERPAIRDFADKTAAPLAWLIHHGLGKTRDEIIGLIFARFDLRSFRMRHLVVDHLLTELRPRRGNGMPYDWIGIRHQRYLFRGGRLQSCTDSPSE